MNPVTMADLEGRFRSLSDEETPFAESLLADAWALATLQLPGLNPAVTSGAANRDAVVAIISAMVIRVLRNPDGVRQWSVDDYSEMRDNTISSGALYLSEDELSLLGTAIGGTRPRRAFSITPDTDGLHRSHRSWPHEPYRYGSFGSYGW